MANTGGAFILNLAIKIQFLEKRGRVRLIERGVYLTNQHYMGRLIERGGLIRRGRIIYGT